MSKVTGISRWKSKQFTSMNDTATMQFPKCNKNPRYNLNDDIPGQRFSFRHRGHEPVKVDAVYLSNETKMDTMKTTLPKVIEEPQIRLVLLFIGDDFQAFEFMKNVIFVCFGGCNCKDLRGLVSSAVSGVSSLIE